MNILLVEDDRSIGSFIRRGIEKAGHLLDWTPEGRTGIEYASLFDYDAVILDLMLPDAHGYDVCREMRRQRWDLPIIILSECDQVSDRIQGLSAGADDYLVKPFVFDELLARLGAIQRRKAPRPPDCEAVDRIILDRASRTVTYAGRSVEVTTREFQLLEFLMKNVDSVVSRASVRSQVWGAEAEISNNAVDVYIGYLRKKIGLNSRLRTVRGVGFKLSSV